MIKCLPLRWNFSKVVPPYNKGVFSSCSKNGMCFHRNHFRNNYIDAVKKDGTEIVKFIHGEDPRVFEKHKKLYLVTNYVNNMKLLILRGANVLHSWKLPFSGKNVMPIDANMYPSYQSRIYAYFQFLDIQNEKLYNVKLFRKNSAAVLYNETRFKIILMKNPFCPVKLHNCVFCGGTSGIQHCRGIMGAGHCTLCPGKKKG